MTIFEGRLQQWRNMASLIVWFKQILSKEKK